MKCNEIRELLSPYIDKMLDKSEIREVEEHLSACGDCRIEYNEIKEMVDLLGQAAMVPVPDEFRFRLKKALNEEKQNMIEAGIIEKSSRKNRWRIITSVAAVFAVGVASFSLYNDILGVLPDQLNGEAQTGAAREESAAPAADENDLYGNDYGTDNDMAADGGMEAQIEDLQEEAERMKDVTRILIGFPDAPEEQEQGLQPVSKASDKADYNNENSVKAKESETEEMPAASPGNADEPGAAAPPDQARNSAAEGADASDQAGEGVSGQDVENIDDDISYRKETSRSLTSSGVEREMTPEEYYTSLLEEKLKDYDYQVLSKEHTINGEWRFRVFIFYGEDGNTYNEEITIIGKCGKIEIVHAGEQMGL